MNYWKQKASPWVSAAVLMGGLASALILFFIVRIENKFQEASLSADEEIGFWLEG